MSETHSLKAPYPISVTELGISIEVSDEQPENAHSPILVTELGISIVVSDEQSEFLYNTDTQLYVC